MVMPVATPTAKVTVNSFTQKRAAAASFSDPERNAFVSKMAMIRPMPIESGTKMKW